jgi:hypothetical protein
VLLLNLIQKVLTLGEKRAEKGQKGHGEHQFMIAVSLML